jgi:predicted GIY-YIG superfamily endonuclease
MKTRAAIAREPAAKECRRAGTRGRIEKGNPQWQDLHQGLV